MKTIGTKLAVNLSLEFQKGGLFVQIHIPDLQTGYRERVEHQQVSLGLQDSKAILQLFHPPHVNQIQFHSKDVCIPLQNKISFQLNLCS